MTTNVLITGATGSIATKLRSYFAELPDLEVRGVCLNPEGDPDVVTADLTTWDDAWVSTFAGTDVVIHLAAEPAAFAGWERIIPLNIDLTLNVYEACRLHGVKRIIFASSNWVVAGHRSVSGPS